MAAHSGWRKDMQDGRPISILKPLRNGGFEWNLNEFFGLLNSPDVKDRPLVIISVAGAFRTGKSLLLNILIKFLNHQTNDKTGDWFNERSGSLEGFKWEASTEAVTSGILVWNKAFIQCKADGEKVAILLMDTQGAFDTQATMADTASIFALSTILSSVQIYNLQNRIQENNLRDLSFFTEYGKLAMEDDHSLKPFQKLMILVRDWDCPQKMEFGSTGGNKQLEKVLAERSATKEDLNTTRAMIRQCFDVIECFLMPHPGLKFTRSQHGKVSDMAEDFKRQMRDFAPSLLSKENLVVKKIGGNAMKGADLIAYVERLKDQFLSGELPEVKPLVIKMAEFHNVLAQRRSRESYCKEMEKVLSKGDPLNPTKLKDVHKKLKNEAIALFKSKRRMGGERIRNQYLEQLKLDIESEFGKFCGTNQILGEKLDATLTVVQRDCKDAYTKRMGMELEQGKCNNLKQLTESHQKNMEAAIAMFHERMTGKEISKLHLQKLRESIAQEFTTLCQASNRIWEEQKDAFESLQKLCHLDYMTRMNKAFLNVKPTNPIVLQELHTNSAAAAIGKYQSSKRKGCKDISVQHLKKLEREIALQFSSFSELNQRRWEERRVKLEKAPQECLDAYNKDMDRVLSARTVTNDELGRLHLHHKLEAIAKLQSENGNSDGRQNLDKSIEDEFEILREQNRFRWDQFKAKVEGVATRSYDAYNKAMEQKVHAAKRIKEIDLELMHKYSESLAIDLFSKEVNYEGVMGGKEETEKQLRQLKEKIRSYYAWYRSTDLWKEGSCTIL